jgi:hypothetical protein
MTPARHASQASINIPLTLPTPGIDLNPRYSALQTQCRNAMELLFFRDKSVNSANFSVIVAGMTLSSKA